MDKKQHKNARTTPSIRRELRESTLPLKVLAEKYNLSRDTVRKWRQRDDTEDRSHRPHRLRTNLTPAQETLVVALRLTLRLSLDDLLTLAHQCVNPSVSRSGLDRCLRRHGVSNLRALSAQERPRDTAPRSATDVVPGSVRLERLRVTQRCEQACAGELFTGIDQATRWVYSELRPHGTERAAASFLRRLVRAAPFRIEQIISERHPVFSASGQQARSTHPFAQRCAALGIEHQILEPRILPEDRPLEIECASLETLVASEQVAGVRSPQEVITYCIRCYNRGIALKRLGQRTPLQALQDWQRRQPERFHRRVDLPSRQQR